jgi:hypothetical protein
MTVALGLLAYELAGADAGAVLGSALAIKMLAYGESLQSHRPSPTSSRDGHCS